MSVDFTTDPLLFVADRQRPSAVKHLRKYVDAYTGSGFEGLADPAQNRITANDFAAVSTFGVNIPPHVTLWLLGEGQSSTSMLLSAIDPEMPIWDPGADLARVPPRGSCGGRCRAHPGAITTARRARPRRASS